jgi:uncharacterized SAM-binding protein YcdF (DUF218 family)
MANLSAAFLKHIGDYMLVDTPLARADVCLVFGGGVNSIALARHAAALYVEGYFSLVVVSGGVGVEGDARSEARIMHDVLLEHGVPRGRILVEEQATNTAENVIFSKKILEGEKVESILAIGQIHAARRFLMTLQRCWPDLKKMFSAPNHFSVPKEEWHLDPAFRRNVLREYRKIPSYRRKKFLSEVDTRQLKTEVIKMQQRFQKM